MADALCRSALSAIQALLLSGDPYHTLNANRGLLFALIPELQAMVGFQQINPYHCRDLWDHTIYSVAQIQPDFALRMTMLLHDLGKLTTKTTDSRGIDHFYGHPQKSVALGGEILARLGVSEEDCILILKLIALHDEPLPNSLPALQKLSQQHGTELLLKLLQVKRADALAQSPEKLDSRISDLEQLRRIISTLP